jgi:hypothetical protein
VARWSEEVGERRSPNTLRRAVRRHELGKLLLEPTQLPHELVVLGVGDLGIVEDVVPVVVVVDEVAELLDPTLGLGETALRALRARHGADDTGAC